MRQFMSNTQITSRAEKPIPIRELERTTRKQVTELIEISYNTYAEYEQGKVKVPFDADIKFFRLERFRKHRDWFMFDETDPAGGQIAPALTHIGQDSTALHHPDQKTGWWFIQYMHAVNVREKIALIFK